MAEQVASESHICDVLERGRVELEAYSNFTASMGPVLKFSFQYQTLFLNVTGRTGPLLVVSG